MLSAKERGRLASLAQTKDCLISLGRAGASPELKERLAVLLAQHELVKLRFGDFKESRRELASELAGATDSELVKIVGNVAVFWRRNPNPDKRKIELDL
jgi:RNA-binding protein